MRTSERPPKGRVGGMECSTAPRSNLLSPDGRVLCWSCETIDFRGEGARYRGPLDLRAQRGARVVFGYSRSITPRNCRIPETAATIRWKSRSRRGGLDPRETPSRGPAAHGSALDSEQTTAAPAVDVFGPTTPATGPAGGGARLRSC